MKNISFIKITLDILMAVVFVLLFNKMAVAGLAFHEIAGLAIGLAFIIHIGLNWKWVKQVTLNIFSKKITAKTRFGYILNILLLVSFAFIIISGILISKVVFPNINLGVSPLFKSLHLTVSYFALLLVSIHIGLHWNWVMNLFKRRFINSCNKKIHSVIAKALVVLMLIFGAYNIYSVNYFSKLSSIVVVFGGNQGVGIGKNMNIPPRDGENNFRKSFPDGERPTRDRSERKGDFPIRGEGKGRFSGNMKGRNSAGSLGMLTSYLSVISVFSIITFYIESLFKLGS
jgi:hypothetical protein